MATNKDNVVIRDALKKIVLGHSFDRASKAPTGMGGVGTARMVHGWVSKIHDDPTDPEYDDYGGTIDVTEFYHERSGHEPVTYKGVMLSGSKDNHGGFLIIPFLHSDVTILMDSGTEYKYVVNYTHADIAQISSHTQSKIGATETEPLDIDDNDSPDYDELPPTGNSTSTEYLVDRITTLVTDKSGKFYQKETDAFGYQEAIDDTRVSVSKDGITHKVKGMGVEVSEDKVVLGKGGNFEPAVKGAQLASLMKDVLLEASQIMTPTLIGTMPSVNAQNFITLMSRIDSTLSDSVFIKD